MSKKQPVRTFFRINIVVLCFVLSPRLFGSDEIRQADSLFKAQKFTEAFEIYEAVFTEKRASPAMLLKMAYIKEGLSDHTNSLYYLDQYYSMTGSRKAFDKMTELAEEHGLDGYEYSDFKLFSNMLSHYNHYILAGLCAMLLLLSVYVSSKKRRGQVAYGSIAGIFVLLILALVLNNRWLVEKNAIIMSDQSILMDGPSAGAESIDVLDKGHKIAILGSDEVWSRILWRDQEVYIRNSNLKRL